MVWWSQVSIHYTCAKFQPDVGSLLSSPVLLRNQEGAPWDQSIGQVLVFQGSCLCNMVARSGHCPPLCNRNCNKGVTIPSYGRASWYASDKPPGLHHLYWGMFSSYHFVREVNQIKESLWDGSSTLCGTITWLLVLLLEALHYGQWLWLWNCEGLLHSLKGRTMAKWILCGHGPLSAV